MRRRNGIPALAFMASFSSAATAFPPDNISPICKTPLYTVVDRWNGHKFIEVPLTWNGTHYEESK